MTLSGAHRQRLGKSSEEAAVRYIRERGLKILERNYRCRIGEVDIVARDGEWLVFVEVRSGRGRGYSHPKYSVGAKKRRTLSRVALYYLKEKGWLENRSRFDVITVVGTGDQIEIEWMKNAFELDY